ncbi:MAG: asparagine synthase (glutamine-hydrolyzing) [Candidatus Shapirobacteria bacterium]|nr:asparagine synthase (glutamine-hydrolyzing) [Candidatus Shapirobacteria bacterium]
MCGISGIISNKEIYRLNERIIAMVSSQHHRGPDNQGYITLNRGCVFGHNRLKIIDLSNSANQPFTSNSGNIIIVFNGEIYNYQAIKKELILEYEFHTKSDTEVMAAAIETKGLDWFLKMSNGIFSIAIYDKSKRNITLVRDRSGIKPLFYCVVDNILIFASEIKAILASGLVNGEMEYCAIDDYFAFRHVREPYTFFKNIYCVESATKIIFPIDNISNYCKSRYWEIPQLNFQKKYNELDCIEELNRKLSNTVKMQMVADVPVGTLLSGGLDSSLITALASYKTNTLDTFSIGFKEKEYNEFEYSRLVAKNFKTNHSEYILSEQDYFKQLTVLTKSKDAPLGVPNEIPLYELSKKISGFDKVILSGEGADEIFFGYGRIFRSPYVFENSENKIKTSFYDYFSKRYEYIPRDLRDRFLSVPLDLRKKFDKNLKKEFINYKNEENVFRFFLNYHIKELLIRLDYTTMQSSLESRVPFLDHTLIDFVSKNIPNELKLKFNLNKNKFKCKNLSEEEISEVYDTPKYILKKVAERYLPHDIIYRKKIGFPVPLQWWDKSLQKTAQILKNRNWLNVDISVEEIVNNMSGQALWMFICLAIFEDNYFNKNYRW